MIFSSTLLASVRGGVGHATGWVTQVFHEAAVDRDASILEIMRLIEHYRSLPYPELLLLADGDAIESQITAKGELVTLSVDVRRGTGDSVRINVSAFGNNWWKHERIDESVLVTSAGNPTT